MTKVISTRSISFPKFNWGITEGIEKDLPEDKEAQERILQEPEISLVGAKKTVEKEVIKK